jgi:hypothetical protein
MIQGRFAAAPNTRQTYRRFPCDPAQRNSRVQKKIYSVQRTKAAQILFAAKPVIPEIKTI